MQRLYLEQNKVAIFPAWEILTRGFGYERVMGVSENGQYIVGEQQRAFQLACGHLIVERWELAGSCACCELIAQEESIRLPQWSSQVCRNCGLKRCACCTRSLCPEHLIVLADKCFCSQCLSALDVKLKEHARELAFQEQIEKSGKLVAYSGRFLGSLLKSVDEK